MSLLNCIAGRIQEINGLPLAFININLKPIDLTEIFFDTIKANNIITKSDFISHRRIGPLYATFWGLKLGIIFRRSTFMKQNST